MMRESQEFSSDFAKNKAEVVDRLIGEGDQWENSLTRAIVNLHDGKDRKNEYGESLPDTNQPPKIIFVNITTAVPYAYAIRECWKQAYPSEETPEFILIDVSRRRWGNVKTKDYYPLPSERMVTNYYQKQAQELRKKGKQLKALNAGVAVFDEYNQPHQKGSIGTLVRDAALLKQAGFTNVNFLANNWGSPLVNDMSQEERPLLRDPEFVTIRKVTFQATGKPLVADMKKIGGLMAQEIKIHSYKP